MSHQSIVIVAELKNCIICSIAIKYRSIPYGTLWGQTGAELKKIVGWMHDPNLPTNRLQLSLICRQVGLFLSFVSNTMLTSINVIQQM